jgi:hypothetical protein
MSVLAATRVRADQSRRWALKLEADNQEAATRHGVDLQSYNHMSLESPPEARREATHAGGGLYMEERHGLAAEVLKIDRR